jgi:uncharacterized protein with gpF-like domain
MNRQERKEFGEKVQRINRRFEVIYFPRVYKALLSKVNDLISVIRSEGLNKGISYLTTDLGNEKLSVVIRDLYRQVGLRHASRTLADLRKQQREAGKSKAGFGMNEQWIKFIEDYLSRYFLDKVSYRVPSTTTDKMLKIITDGVEKGLGIDEIVKNLSAEGFIKRQAAVITRTEIKRAGETGAAAASKTFEFEQQKVWITIKDRRTRGADAEDHADHWHMDGQTVDDSQKFFDARSGVYLDFPGDPDAPGKDTINCRCTHGYEAKRDANGRLIPKKRNVVVIRNFNSNRLVVTI